MNSTMNFIWSYLNNNRLKINNEKGRLPFDIRNIQKYQIRTSPNADMSVSLTSFSIIPFLPDFKLYSLPVLFPQTQVFSCQLLKKPC